MCTQQGSIAVDRIKILQPSKINLWNNVPQNLQHCIAILRIGSMHLLHLLQIFEPFIISQPQYNVFRLAEPPKDMEFLYCT